MFHKCKVTVIQRGFSKEIVNSYVKNPEKFSTCDRIEDNQEFIISNPYEMPEGICPGAWADIRPYIIAIASGGTFDYMNEKNSALATCSDLFRPVIFKIEKVDSIRWQEIIININRKKQFAGSFFWPARYTTK